MTINEYITKNYKHWYHYTEAHCYKHNQYRTFWKTPEEGLGELVLHLNKNIDRWEVLVANDEVDRYVGWYLKQYVITFQSPDQYRLTKKDNDTATLDEETFNWYADSSGVDYERITDIKELYQYFKDKLNPKEQKLVEQVVEQQMYFKEIAEEEGLGRTDEAIRMRYQKIIKKLKKYKLYS